MVKANEKEKKEYVIDAKDRPLGRLASEIAKKLRGKDSATFSPNTVPEIKVKIINLPQIYLSGKKWKMKEYKTYSGYPGGLRTKKFEEMFDKNPQAVFRKAVEKMLPKNKIRKKILHNLIFE